MYEKFLQKNKNCATVHRILMAVFAICILIVCSVFLFPLLGHIGTFGIAVVPILGPAFNDLYKKWGKEVFSHNHYMLYGRGYKVPHNKKTTAQSVHRQLVRKYAKFWKDVSVNQTSWNQYASTHPLEKKGRIIYYTGEITFIQFNIIAQQVSGTSSIVTNAPSNPTMFPILMGLVVSAETGPDTITVEPMKIGNYPTGTKIKIYTSPMLSFGVFTQQKMSVLGIYDPTSVPLIDITSDYEAKYGSLVVGSKIFFQACLCMPTGEQDLMVKANTVVIVVGP